MRILDDAIDWAISQGLPFGGSAKTFGNLTFEMPTLNPDYRIDPDGEIQAAP